MELLNLKVKRRRIRNKMNKLEKFISLLGNAKTEIEKLKEYTKKPLKN